MLWHALRRKWATERKRYPVKDVMQAGGWLDEATLVASYQHADPGHGSPGERSKKPRSGTRCRASCSVSRGEWI
jgi:hypothetical protein